MRVCPEACTLRTFCPAIVRDHVLANLVRRYAAGRRAAGDVLDALNACKAQLRYDECSRLWRDAAAAVTPVPMLLCSWACDHVGILGVDPLRALLHLATFEPPVARLLRPAIDDLLGSPYGLAACLHCLQFVQFEGQFLHSEDPEDPAQDPAEAPALPQALPEIAEKLAEACANMLCTMLSLHPQPSFQLRHQFERAFGTL